MERERERVLLYRKLLKKVICILFVKVKISVVFKYICMLLFKFIIILMKLKMLILICKLWKMIILCLFVGELGVLFLIEWMIFVLVLIINVKVGVYLFLINSGK